MSLLGWALGSEDAALKAVKATGLEPLLLWLVRRLNTFAQRIGF